MHHKQNAAMSLNLMGRRTRIDFWNSLRCRIFLYYPENGDSEGQALVLEEAEAMGISVWKSIVLNVTN